MTNFTVDKKIPKRCKFRDCRKKFSLNNKNKTYIIYSTICLR